MTGEEGTKVSLNESATSHNHGLVSNSVGANDDVGSNGRSLLVVESVSSNSDSPNNNNHLKEFSSKEAAQQSISQESGVLSDIEVKRRNGRLSSRDDDPGNGSCGLLHGPPELSEEELADISKERLQHLFSELQQYIRVLKKENAALKESDEKNRMQQQEYSRRENSLFVRLSSKEQEIQEYASQLSELKTSYSNVTSGGGMRSSLLDPAVNLIIQKMKKELEETKKKLDDTQNDLNAWKFTPDSNTGKRLMAKCRMLYQENEELGKMITSGRLAKLESDLALQKSLTEEMKKSQSEMDECIQDLDEDVDGMHSTVCFYQKQLADREALLVQLGSGNNSSTSASNNSLANSSRSDNSVVLQNVLISDLCETCRTTQTSKMTTNSVSTNHPQLKLESDVSSNRENDQESSDDGLNRTNSHETNERTLVVMNGEDAVQNDSKDESVLNVQKNQCHLSTKRLNDTDTEKEYNGEASPPPSKRTKLTNYTKQQQNSSKITSPITGGDNGEPVASTRNGSADH